MQRYRLFFLLLFFLYFLSEQPLNKANVIYKLPILIYCLIEYFVVYAEVDVLTLGKHEIYFNQETSLIRKVYLPYEQE